MSAVLTLVVAVGLLVLATYAVAFAAYAAGCLVERAVVALGRFLSGARARPTGAVPIAPNTYDNVQQPAAEQRRAVRRGGFQARDGAARRPIRTTVDELARVAGITRTLAQARLDRCLLTGEATTAGGAYLVDADVWAVVSRPRVSA